MSRTKGVLKHPKHLPWLRHCFLHASKAFDRVSHLKLFNRLLEKNLPPTIIRLLFSWYKDQKSSVLWNKILSEKFQFRMVWDRGLFYHPSYLLFILMNYWSGYNHKQLAIIGHTILLELLDTQMTLSLWLPLPQHYEWCLIHVVSLPLTITSSLIRENTACSVLSTKLITQFNYCTDLCVWWSISHAGRQSLLSGSYLAFWSIWHWWYSEDSNWHVLQSQLPFINLFCH